MKCLFEALIAPVRVAVWASHNLYFVKDLTSFFRRVKNALAANGVFACLHEGLSREKTAPERVVLMRLSSALEKD